MVDFADNPFHLADSKVVAQQDAQKIAAQLRSKPDNAPSAKQTTNILPQASLNQLTASFDVTRIPLAKLDQMRRDPIIAFALYFIKAQVLRARWMIKCPDPQVAAFVDQALREIYASLVDQWMLKLSFGYQAMVKRFETRPGLDWKYADPLDETNPEKPVWQEGAIDPLIWKNFVALPTRAVEPIWTDSGEFNGIKYTPSAVKATGEPAEFDVLHSLWVTNEKESVFGSLWGYPRIGYAYRFWWSFWFNWGLADRHFEKDADPPAIVYFPSDAPVDSDGRDARSIAMMIGDSARSNSTIALPSDMVQDDQGVGKSLRKWELTFAKGGGNFEVFSERFNQLRMMMLSAVMVPEEAFQAKGGTAGYNSTGQLQDAFQASQINLLSELDYDINRYIIPQLVAANFPERQVKAVKVTKGFDTEDIELAKVIIQGAANSDLSQLDLDMASMLDAVGLPRLSPSAIAKKNAELAAAAQQTAPEPTQAVSGQAAGVTKQGLYYAPRDTINLQSSSPIDEGAEAVFLAELTNTPALRDPMILADSQRIRSIWRTALEYDLSIAVNLLNDYKGDLQLDETYLERFFRRAKGRAYETAATTRRALMGVMRRASTSEFERAGLTDFSWDPFNSERASRYLAERADVMADKITSTTRDQVRTYLADLVRRQTPPDQMAAMLRAHFKMLSGWRSDQVVRTEVGRAYNMAVLLAAQDAGIKQVQALDAQLGPERSDPHCIARNGKIFSIDQAFLELEDEHPNGTLQFRLLRKPVKVKRLPVPDGAPTPLLASYDETDGEIVVNLSEAVTEEQANAYLVQVVDATTRAALSDA